MLTAALLGPGAALGCGLAYLAIDYLRKVVDAPPRQILFVFIGLQIPVLAGWAWYSGGFGTPASAYWLPGVADIAAGMGANVLYLLALRRSPLSLMVPLLALVPGVTLVFSGVMLGEWPSLMQTIGIVTVVAGLFVLYSAGEPGSGSGVLAPLANAVRNLRREPGARLMMGVVVLWSTTPGFDKLCIAQSSVGMHGFIQVAAITALIGLWIAILDGPRAFGVKPEARRPLLLAGVLGGVGYVLQLAAYQLMLVAAVELIRRVSGILGAQVVGRFALAEPMTPAKIAGVLIIAAGLPLVLWN
ncbi:MAG: DMT family transporter [Rhodospirillaceae bacterium]|nr:DMT family transporter [Rhodospirillaceae bacterium]